jgi:hypothetical protein
VKKGYFPIMEVDPHVSMSWHVFSWKHTFSPTLSLIHSFATLFLSLYSSRARKNPRTRERKE